MADINTVSMLDYNSDVDKLTYEIFSILENKFLFGYDDRNLSSSPKNNTISFQDMKSAKHETGNVRILSIDGGGSTNGILAAKSLSVLESSLKRKSGNPNAHISDYFDVVAGSGSGGVLAALLFTKGKTGTPLFTANEALNYMQNISNSSPRGIFKRLFSKKSNNKTVFTKTFGEITLKDSLKSVLIPCFDLNTAAPFVFSRADAVEIDGYDFKMKDVCAATMAVGPVVMMSVDRKTKISAVGGALAMNNPTAAAITHVLNNKQEFPFCSGVEDLLVVSLGNGESNPLTGKLTSSPAALVKIAGDGVSDMVDQTVSMAFGECRASNYVRIQGNATVGESKKGTDALTTADEMLAQNSIESVLFQGKKLGETTNIEKLELSAGQLIKEQERRKSSILPSVLLKQASASPRTSSATTLSTLSSN